MSLGAEPGQVIERAKQAEHRARLRLREVAELAGLSKTKVREDVRRGYLTVVRIPCHTRWMALVEPDEADRYLATLSRTA